MWSTYEQQKQAFREAIAGLSNVRKEAAWEFVRALEARIEALDEGLRKADAK